jgi:SAM-dependent methyltransferase
MECSKSVIELETNHPVAYASPDHLVPTGTRKDNHSSSFFIAKLESIFGNRILRVLDLGCSGGGFVKELFDLGHVAVGVEGSDFSKVRGRAEWRTIPELLFTSDIAEPFRLKENGEPMQFDVITAFDVVEHLTPDQIPRLVQNLRTHLLPTGIFCATISLREEVIDGVRLHQSVRPEPWWARTFASLGLVRLPALERYIKNFVRNARIKRSSMAFVGTFSPKDSPATPRQNIASKVRDFWIESKAQRFLQRTIEGE